jgi:hypothetical protein
MRTRTTAGVLAVLALTLTACGSSDDSGDDKAQPSANTASTTASATPTTTPSTAPSLSQAELSRQCSEAVAEAAPGWQDWNFDLAGWQDDPRTPDECQGLADEEFPPRGNRAFQDALIDGLEIADDPRARQ